MFLFTQKFNEVLKYSPLKQKEIADKLGVHRNTITEYKKGRAYPSLQQFTKLCEILDVSADYLLGIKEY